MGKDTAFTEKLQSGDAMLVLHPNTCAYSALIVRILLSRVPQVII